MLTLVRIFGATAVYESSPKIDSFLSPASSSSTSSSQPRTGQDHERYVSGDLSMLTSTAGWLEEKIRCAGRFCRDGVSVLLHNGVSFGRNDAWSGVQTYVCDEI